MLTNVTSTTYCYESSSMLILFYSVPGVYLSRGQSRNEGNVYAYNSESGITGPVCDDSWDISDVS